MASLSAELVLVHGLTQELHVGLVEGRLGVLPFPRDGVELGVGHWNWVYNDLD